MSTPVITVLGVVIIVTLLSPFFSKKMEQKSANVQGNYQQEKEHIFSQLADLEYDYQMGKLSQSDFDETKGELTVRASKFVQPMERNLEQIEFRVDNEIESYLKKQGLELKKEGDYES